MSRKAESAFSASSTGTTGILKLKSSRLRIGHRGSGMLEGDRDQHRDICAMSLDGSKLGRRWSDLGDWQPTYDVGGEISGKPNENRSDDKKFKSRADSQYETDNRPLED